MTNRQNQVIRWGTRSVWERMHVADYGSLPAEAPWTSTEDAGGYGRTDPDPYGQHRWHVTAGWKPSGWTPNPEPYRRRTGRTHGLIGTYKDGCRCDECKKASRDYVRRYRAAKRAAAAADGC